MPALCVVIHAARQIAAAHKGKYSDSFVKVRTFSAKRKTKVVSKTCDPVWDAEFFFNIPEDETLDLYVWHCHSAPFGTDKFLGHARIPATPMPLPESGVLVGSWYPLGPFPDDRSPSKTGIVDDRLEISGEICVSVIEAQVAFRSGGSRDESYPGSLGSLKSKRPRFSLSPGNFLRPRSSDMDTTEASNATDTSILTEPGFQRSRPDKLPNDDGPVPRGATPRRTETGSSPTPGEGSPAVVRVTIHEARDLAAADSNGLSDPFVKVKINDVKLKTQVCRKTLHPHWEETFEFVLKTFEDSTSRAVEVTVYDWDAIGQNDFLGYANIPYEENKLCQWLPLHKRNEEDNVSGEICVSIEFVPPTGIYAQMAEECADGLRQPRVAAMVQVIEGRDLIASDRGGTSDPFCTIRLSNTDSSGPHVHTTPTKYRTLTPVWGDKSKKYRVPLPAPRSQGDDPDDEGEEKATYPSLRITCYDRDQFAREFLGCLDIELEGRKAGDVVDEWIPLRAKKAVFNAKWRKLGELHIRVEFVVNADDMDMQIYRGKRRPLGLLQVDIKRGYNLPAMDMGGTSDPYVVLDIEKESRRTAVVQKTLNPIWEQKFDFTVTEVLSDLRLCVYDYDKHGDDDVIGEVIIPMTWVSKIDERELFLELTPVDKKLKKKGLMKRPASDLGVIQIILKFNRDMSPFQALCAQPLYYPPYTQDKFKASLIKTHIARIESVVAPILTVANFLDDVRLWNTPVLVNVSVLLAWTILCLVLYSWAHVIVPGLVIAGVLLAGMYSKKYARSNASTKMWKDELDDDGPGDEEESDEKKSIVEKYREMMEMMASFQNKLGKFATVAERVKHAFTWADPDATLIFLSGVLAAIVALSMFLCIIPCRYICVMGMYGFMWPGFKRNVLKKTKKAKSFDPYKFDAELYAKRLFARVPDTVELTHRRIFERCILEDAAVAELKKKSAPSTTAESMANGSLGGATAVQKRTLRLLSKGAKQKADQRVAQQANSAPLEPMTEDVRKRRKSRMSAIM
eukprot:Rmarinus@m.11981